MNVVITGFGAVSPAGRSVDRLWSAVVAAEPQFRPITRFCTEGFYTNLAAEVEKDGFILDFANDALKEAMEDSGLRIGDPARAGVAIGTTLGAKSYADAFVRDNIERKEMPPRLSLYHCVAGSIADQLDVTGPVVTFDVACASSVHAVGYGMELIRRGKADVMITGGADMLSPFVFSGFHSLQALAHGTVRPFDGGRDGMLIGEGAGIIVLESEAHAQKRGAKIRGRVRGWGFMEDATHMTAPDRTGSGMARTIEMALADAGVLPEDIGYVSAHGTATRFNDRMETLALKSALGSVAGSIPISSTKSVHGHCLGASGAIEIISSVRAMEEGVVPPTANYETMDPDCDLDYVPNEARKHRFDSFLKVAAGFGGQNGALIVSG